MTTIDQLTCEYRINPLGIDVINPRLSWKLQGERRGIRQTAYQILAADTEANLDSMNLLWDSEKIASDQSVLVPYEGPALVSGQRVYWKIRCWDELGEACESPNAWWEMGLLRQDDWQADWIGMEESGGPRTTSPAPFLRKEFSVPEKPVQARLYATAIGLYECYLNGARVGDAVLTPGWTDYNKHIQYQVYDVTDLLNSGENTIGAILGDGWGVGHVAWVGRQRYADQPRFLGQLVLTYRDGRREVIPSDGSWKAVEGPIREADLLMGESYDARREFPGWMEAGYEDASWTPVHLFTAGDAQIVATNGPLMKRMEFINPANVRKIPDFVNPKWIFDMGQNMVGWIRLRVRGDKGRTITIRYAEALNPDGSLYTINLRTARNNDFYTLKGEGEEIFEPRFTFHGFRYVEIQGYPGTPDDDAVTGIVVYSDIPATGSFECSNPLINQLQHNILWSQKGNFLDVPTDCPQRDERLGWTGDAQVFIRTAAFNMNVAGFFSKWMQDLQDAQYEDGAYPAIAPNPGTWSIQDGGPAWSDAGIICPWVVYQVYGDKRILETQYPSLERFINFLTQTSKDGTRCYPGYTGWLGFGDWLALDGSDGLEGATSKELIGTAFYAYSTGLMAKIARILRKKEDEAGYEELSRQIREVFIQRFVNPDGTIVGGTQTSYLLALQFDLLPEGLHDRAAEELNKSILERGTHLSTGFVGTPFISWVLTQFGHLDTAYALLNQKTWPSWLYSVTQGATTIWERWNGWTEEEGFADPGMNSFNHYSYGAVGEWLYAVPGGINLDPEAPGYKHMILRPQPGGGLTWVRTSLDTQYGLVRSEWKLEDGQFTWEVCVPANTTATLYIPAHSLEDVNEQGESDGISFVEMKAGWAVFEVTSGNYSFVVKP